MFTADWIPPRSLLWVLLAFAIAATAVLCIDVPDAEAAESSGVKAWLAELQKARKQKGGGVLGPVLERSVELHNGLDDPAARAKIQAALGGVLRDKKAGSARSAAAKALGGLKGAQAVYKKFLKGALPAAKRTDVDRHQLAALEAVSALAPEAAIGDLLKLVKKGRSREAVKLAINALGGYGASAKREVVLKELLGACSKLHASASKASKKAAKKKKPSKNAKPTKSSEAVYAWAAYEPAFLAALNRLTGHERSSVDEWLSASKEAGTKLAGLFREST